MAAALHHPNHTLQILSVEDEASDRELVSLYLSASGLSHVVVFTDNGEEMRHLLSRQRWDVVLCDHRLPAFSAREALALTCQLRSPPPLIVVSGNIGEAAAVQLMQDGAADFVHKSNLANLGPAIARTIASHDLQLASLEAQWALRESEQRFRTLTELAPVGIYLTDVKQRVIYANERFRQFTGLRQDQVVERDWRDALRIDRESKAFQSTNAFALAHDTPLDFEVQIERSGADPIWLIGQIVAQYDEDDDLMGHLGVVTDISERKRAEINLLASEQRLRDLSSHIFLIEEAQRASIAREIHDDIGSSLTGLAMDVAWLKRELNDAIVQRPEIGRRLEDLTQLIKDTGSVSRRIAKALRPGILDQGIMPALQWLTLEHERRFGVSCEFVAPTHEPNLSEGQSISLFRVVQEALNNIAKHAAATEVVITMFIRPRELTLEIRDNGRGLQNARADAEGSFGLLGMRERIQSIGGWMEVDSLPGRGVTLMIGIPHRATKQLVDA